MTFAGEAARETQKPLEFTSPATPGGTYGRGASLQQLVAEALRNNPEIRAARKELEAASQRIAPAGA
ncbi:MAG: TolC family protein, partial [Burkholderiales bacterium]